MIFHSFSHCAPLAVIKHYTRIKVPFNDLIHLPNKLSGLFLASTHFGYVANQKYILFTFVFVYFIFSDVLVENGRGGSDHIQNRYGTIGFTRNYYNYRLNGCRAKRKNALFHIVVEQFGLKASRLALVRTEISR